jgi:flavin reductase (DIM6/NTAB) family NADH-FMN oxidoreductase RutF
VLVCVNKSAGAHDTIKASQAFCWNILAAQHSALARTFSGQDGIKSDVRFTEGLWQTLVTGAPSLIEAICSFDCRVVEAHDAGSHTIFVGTVLPATQWVPTTQCGLSAPPQDNNLFRLGTIDDAAVQ